jgi:hypothetical protein
MRQVVAGERDTVASVKLVIDAREIGKENLDGSYQMREVRRSVRLAKWTAASHEHSSAEHFE